MTDDATSPHSLAGAIAVVTGAAQGLGLGIAEQLAYDGATVIIADLQTEKAQREADRLGRECQLPRHHRQQWRNRFF